MDSVNSFHIKKCPPIKKAVFELVKKMVEWIVMDIWDEEDRWLLEGRNSLDQQGQRPEGLGQLPPSYTSPPSLRWSPSPSTSG